MSTIKSWDSFSSNNFAIWRLFLRFSISPTSACLIDHPGMHKPAVPHFEYHHRNVLTTLIHEKNMWCKVSVQQPHSHRRPQRPKPVSFLQSMLFGFGRPFLNKEAQVNDIHWWVKAIRYCRQIRKQPHQSRRRWPFLSWWRTSPYSGEHSRAVDFKSWSAV